MERTSTLVRRLVLVGLALAVTPFLSRWIDVIQRYDPDRLVQGHQVCVVLFWTLVVMAIVLVLRAVVSVLHSRGRSHPVLSAVHSRGFSGALWDVYRRRSFPHLRLGLLIAAWGTGIVSGVLFLATTGVLEGSEIHAMRWGVVQNREDTSGVARTFLLSTPDDNPVAYLRYLAAVARSLRSAGAKLIVAEDPGEIVIHDTRLAATIAGLRDSLRLSGDVLLCRRLETWFRPNLNYPMHSSGTHVAVHPGSATIIPTLRTPRREETFAPAWAPCLFVHPGAFVDVGLIAAGRYLAYRDSLPVVCEPGRVVYGTLTVSVNSNGLAPLLGLVQQDHRFLHVSAGSELESDTLWYFFNDPRAFTFTRSLSFPPEGTAQVRGTIVFIDWMRDGTTGLPSQGYADVIQSLLAGTTIRQYPQAPLWLTVLVTILCAVLSARVSLRAVVPAILGLGAGLYLGGAWLLFQHQVLLHMSYPAVAALLCAAILPLTRLAHEHP